MSRLRTQLLRLRSDVAAALRGDDMDFTTGPLPRAVVVLAVPMVLELAMESVFAVVDVFFVARLGAEAVAAVGITESFLTLVFAVALGLGAATTAVVARRVGEKDHAAAARAAGQAIVLAAGFALVTGIVGAALAPRLLTWMGAGPTVVAVGTPYTRWILGASAVVYFLFVINAAFRGAGDAAIAMRVLWLANLVNLVLDPCLIFGLGPFPELGLEGAAVATVIGRGTGVLFQLYVLFGGRGRAGRRLPVSWSDLRPVPALLAKLLRISANGILQYLMATSGWLVMVRIVAVFGAPAVAAYTIALRLLLFVFLPAWGMSNAAATLVGQCLGARDAVRAERAVWLTARYNLALLGSAAVVFLAIPERLMGLITADAEVIGHGIVYLRLLGCALFFDAFGLVAIQAFNGAGDTTTPMRVNGLAYWLVQIPVALGLALGLGWGPPGVATAILCAEITMASTAVFLFRRGRWRRTVV